MLCFCRLADHLLALSDAVDHAATTGDADLAYGYTDTFSFF